MPNQPNPAEPERTVYQRNAVAVIPTATDEFIDATNERLAENEKMLAGKRRKQARRYAEE